jgi:hypothetical protein
MMNNPTGRIDRSQNRRATPEYDRQRASYNATLQASIERREKRRREEEEAKRQSELQAQKDAALSQRDKQQQKYGQADTAQRAYYAANDAADDFNRTKQLNRQQQKDVRRRDTLNNDFTLTRDREQARDQQDQDKRRFGLSTKENEQKFGYQMMENDQQFGHQIQRDRFQHGNTLERDGRQFGYDSIRAQQQHGNTMQRDSALNEFDTQRDILQNQFQGERDNRRNMFDVNREARQQQYQQQNQYQRETAEISQRWQETIQQARNAGMDFSERQKQEMKELDAVFRKTVMTNDDLDEGLKQQAMLLHQKKLSAIVPEEKIANPKEGLESSLMFHEQTGTWFMQGRDSKGFPTYQPIGMQSDGMAEQQKEMQAQQEKERQLAEKTNERRIEAERKRMEDFGQTVNDLMTELDPVTDSPLYPTRSDALAAAKDRFAQTEEFYRRNYGLDPHPIYKDDRPDGMPVPFRPTTGPQKPPVADQYRQRLQERQAQQPQPPQQQGFQPKSEPQAPVPMSSTNIDSHMEKTMAGGDKEAAAALQTIKLISAKNNGGPPPAGSQDLMDMVKAIKYLREKGIAIQPSKQPVKPFNAPAPYGGDSVY